MARISKQICNTLKILPVIVVCYIQAASVEVKADEPSWLKTFLQVKIFETNISDMPKLFSGAHLMGRELRVEYEVDEGDYGFVLDEGILIVEPSSGKECMKDVNGNQEKVPKGKVRELIFYPLKVTDFSEIPRDVLYSSTKTVSDNGTIVFENFKEGIAVFVENRKKTSPIVQLKRFPSEKQYVELDCISSKQEAKENISDLNVLTFKNLILKPT